MVNKSFIVALTGGIASGKSTVGNLFAELGIPIVDADKIAQDIVQKNKLILNQLIEHFGLQLLDRDGHLNRPYLREIIFNSTRERQWLNHFLHPLIHQKTQKKFKHYHSSYLIWIIPLLVETNLMDEADRILVIESKLEIQLERLKKRDNISEKLAKNMLLSQTSNKIRRTYADDIIENNNQIDSLRDRVLKLHRKYLRLAGNCNIARAN